MRIDFSRSCALWINGGMRTMKFIIEGWSDEGEDKETVVEVDIEGEPTLWFPEFEFGIELTELEQLIKFVKEM